MKDFARLERHEGLQVLVRIEAKNDDDGNYGPCVVARCDPSVTIEIASGPYSDDEAGWSDAQKRLEGFDLQKYARDAKELAAKCMDAGAD